MKVMKIALPVLGLLALSLILSGCPKGDKMMKNDTPKSNAVELVG
jgi:hypothetical protein